MAFNDVLVQDGAGAVWLLDVSFDNFSTVPYRWSTVSCLVGSDQYEARITEKGLSKIARAFGRENTPTAGTVALRLDNTDFGADWMVDRSTVASQLFRARFKLTLLLYPPGVPASYQTKVIGTFKCIDFPARDRESVAVQLADDTMGLFDSLLTSPTIRDWADDAGTTVNNSPLSSHFGPIPAPNSDWDTPLPLAFGDGRLRCFPASYQRAIDNTPSSVVPSQVFNSPMYNARAIVVCATTSTADAVTNDIRALWGIYGEDVMIGTDKWSGAGSTISIPRTFTVPSDISAELKQALNLAAGQTLTVWEPQKTQTISKDGASWRILWVKFDAQNYSLWFQLTRKIPNGPQDRGESNPSGFAVPQAPASSAAFSIPRQFAAFTHFQVLGTALSARTAPTVAGQAAVNVIRDLISYYSKGSSSDIDTARFATALQMNPAEVSGVLLPQRPVTTRFRYGPLQPPSDALSNGQLRQALSDICQSADLDLAMTWEGKIAVHGSCSFSFANLTTTRVALDETRCNDVVERIPSKGERWAPYNRVYTIDPSGAPHGPYDSPDASLDWGVTLERTLQGKWLQPFDTSNPLYSQMVWYSQRRLESVVRPVIRFVTDREGLQLDLGDLFDFTWTRGGSGGPYTTAAVFRVESMTVDPETLLVGIEAVWVDDIRTVKPYLLDNEALTVVVQSSAGRTATVTDGDATVTFSSGNLVTEGIGGQHILVLKDATQGVNVFTRCRAIKIASVTGGATLELDTADLDFDAPAGAAVATWEIRRGQPNYPDSSSDPTNYPNDSEMYGKACDDADSYSFGATANKLL